jgi:hypothetical protein
MRSGFLDSSRGALYVTHVVLEILATEFEMAPVRLVTMVTAFTLMDMRKAI